MNLTENHKFELHQALAAINHSSFSMSMPGNVGSILYLNGSGSL